MITPTRPKPSFEGRRQLANRFVQAMQLLTLIGALLGPTVSVADMFSDISGNTWVKIGPGTYPGRSAGQEPPDGIAAFSGMAIDEANGQILLFGGGHNNYWGNEVWAWSIANRSWRKMYEPDRLNNIDLAVCQASVDNTNRPGMWLPSNRPISRHTYDSVEFISHLGVLMAAGGSTYSGINEYLWETSSTGSWCYVNSPGDLWFYSPVTNTWSYRGSARTDTARMQFNVAAYDRMTGKVVVLGRSSSYQLVTSIYDPATNEFQQKSPLVSAPWHGDVAATYDSKRHYVLFFGGEYPKSDKLWAYSVDQNTWLDLSPPTGPRPAAGGGYGIAYDSAADVIVVYGAAGLWIYDYATKAWSQPKTTVGPQPTSQVHGKLKYDAQRNVTFLAYVNSGFLIDVWAYRHKTAPGTTSTSTTAVSTAPVALPPRSGNTTPTVSAPGTPTYAATSASNSPPAPTPPTVTSQTSPPATQVPSGPVNVVLTVREALPAGVAGRARASEPVTVGVPLPEASGIKSPTALGLIGAGAAQFRPLAFWPNGNIRWVLVDFQADVAAGGSTQVTLTSGAGNFGGVALASDHGQSIAIDTGRARFSIRKANFNVFDQVTVNGSQVLQPGGGRLLIRDSNDNVFSSLNDSMSTAVVEENGPVRAVIRAQGALLDPSGARLADYTLRLHFFRGKTYVKGVATLRNARKTFPTPLLFNSAEIVVPITITNASVSFARATDVVSRSLASGNSAHLFQGYTTDKARPEAKECFNWDPPVPGTCTNWIYSFDQATTGLGIAIGSEAVSTLGNASNATAGWASINDASGRGLLMAMKSMSAYWPAGFELTGNGSASIELFSKRNAKKSLKLAFAKHEAREIMWDFSATEADKATIYHRLNHPLIAHAGFSHYQDTRAIYGQREFPSVAEQARFFADTGKAAMFTGFSNPAPAGVYRVWPWAMGGGANQIDFPLGDLQDFLRTGHPGFYLRGEQRAAFDATTAVAYSDDFSNETNVKVTDPVPQQRSVNGSFFDSEHAHMMAMPLYYFMSGMEEIRDGIIDYGEALDRGQLANNFALSNTPYFRAWSRIYRNLALLYEFSCQVGSCNGRYRAYVSNATNLLLDSRDNSSLGVQSPRGRNLDRGYVYWDSSLTSGFGKRVVHSFFHTQVHFEAVWQALRVMRETAWNYHRTEEMEDYLHGLSLFFLDEYLSDTGGPGVTDVFFMYDYPLDESYATPSAASSTPYDVSRAGVFAFVKTGNPVYLEKANKLVWRVMEYATGRNPSELQGQALMAAHFRKPASWKPLSLQVIQSGASYTLRWTVPAGAKQIQIKHASLPIVEWLGYERVTRNYRYPPAQYRPYFAALNVANEPAPGIEGATQEFQLTSLPCGSSCKFAAKYYSED